MLDTLLTEFSKKRLTEIYSILREHKVFSTSWTKEQIVESICAYLDKIGFKPFKCYCGTYFAEESGFRLHARSCKVLMDDRESPDHDRRFNAYAYDAHLYRDPTQEILALEKAIQDQYPSCICGSKYHRVLSITDKNLDIIRCGQCNSISIVERLDE